MPLPFALDHINLWLIEDGGSWAVVDTGVPDDRTRNLWRGVLAGPMAGRPVSRLLVSHFHPDHMGLAAWFTRKFPVVMETTQAEWLYGRMLSLDTGEAFREASLNFYRGAGFGPDLLTLVAERGNAYGARIKHIPTVCRRLRDGDRLHLGPHVWRVMVGEGHAPEMACLWCEERNVLISGDQLLPSISPNVSVWPSEPDANPLGLFLKSLEKFRELPADCLVLPSHGRPFFGLHERIDALLRHHQDRLAETLDACRRPISAYDLLAIMFPRELDHHQLFFAIGESLAHLHYLVEGGLLGRTIDGMGIHRFHRI
ncbi:MBL fold metallo-hydrolase [Telmatospirillum siberiense]|uniref:MBL fold metallo-hydrolase n=2 Tax=Telmatospirillum siberiense TaxID=382514 RepID=A0A2N3PQ85_9PROT|nr:MBL fold metallo-hydrolase [Telmatospirillum siberiense]